METEINQAISNLQAIANVGGCSNHPEIEEMASVTTDILVGVLRKMGMDTGLVGKSWFVKSPNFEGFADALSVNDDDTVNVRSWYTGAIYIVTKDDLSEPLESAAQHCVQPTQKVDD